MCEKTFHVHVCAERRAHEERCVRVRECEQLAGGVDDPGYSFPKAPPQRFKKPSSSHIPSLHTRTFMWKWKMGMSTSAWLSVLQNRKTGSSFPLGSICNPSGLSIVLITRSCVCVCVCVCVRVCVCV
jgi:hypothetical protein